MVHVSHSSFMSSQDQNGFCHTLSIDPKAIERQLDFAIYEGKARSDGGFCDSRNGSIVIAKFTENKCVLSDHWAQSELEKAKIAQEAAKVFNNTMRHLKKMQDCKCKLSSTPMDCCASKDVKNVETLNFQIPQTSEIDSVSSFDRTRQKGEQFLILEKLLNPQIFICSKNSSGPSKSKKNSKKKKRSKSLSCSEKDHQNATSRNRTSSEGDCSEISLPNNFSTEVNVKDISCKCLHAFVHYFSSYYNGDKAIDYLRGQFCEHSGFTLTVPVIHSKHREHGTNDEGVDGISRVIANHVCSDLCCHLPPMCQGTTSEDDLKWRMQGS